MFFTPVFVSRVPLPPVNFLHVSTITAPLNTKVTVINLSIFCNICPSSYISNNTAALQYLTHHLGFFINKSQWELVAVPPSLSVLISLMVHDAAPSASVRISLPAPPITDNPLCFVIMISTSPPWVWAGGHSPRPPSWHSYTGYYHFIWHNNLISITPAIFRKESHQIFSNSSLFMVTL